MLKQKTHKVQVVVKSAGGIHAAKKFFPEGLSDQELTDVELQDVFHRSAIVVMQDGKHVQEHTALAGGSEYNLDSIEDPDEKAKADPNSAYNAAKVVPKNKASHKGVVSAPGPTLTTPGAEPSYDGTHADGSTKEPDGVSEITTPIAGGTLHSKTTTTTSSDSPLPGADTSQPFPDEPLDDGSKHSKKGKRF